MICIDFETEAIQDRPAYPPKPVGVAIHDIGDRMGLGVQYLAWGHPSGNNTTRDEAHKILRRIWDSGLPLLFHHAKFDLDVAETWFKLPRLPWDRIHDTLYLLFLDDPHSDTLSLKPASQRYLGLAPEEQDRVKAWLVAHGVIAANQKAGAYIAKCDGMVVAEYAIGDVDRTVALFRHLMPKIREAGMEAAYDRERKLLPILLDNERKGIRVDLERLEEDLKSATLSMGMVEDWLRNALKTPALNLDARNEVADALAKVGAVKEWKTTPTGRRSTSKANMVIAHPAISTAFDYRNRLQTLISQSMDPWYRQAKAGKGYIYTEWNQVRQTHDRETGTRTGRLSCARFMNITKRITAKTPAFIRGAMTLPTVRKYLLPDPGCAWGHRDYNQQEFRILGHYESGRIMLSYQTDPRTDYHDNMAARILDSTGLKVARDQSKILNFGMLYGMGLQKLMAALKVDLEQATRLRNAVRQAAPDVQALDRELKRRGKAGEPIRTWGGRRYYCEPPKIIDGREQTFEYKLLNYLIQGSAADCTKEAIIRYNERKVNGRLLVTVHDEINISAPTKSLEEEMEILRICMEGVNFDVPMLTDGKAGPSWGELKEI